MDQLNALPILDQVLREVLRLYAPVATISRIAEQDAVIPLAEPVRDKKGAVRSEILYVHFPALKELRTRNNILILIALLRVILS
jgi:hypothetical protein